MDRLTARNLVCRSQAARNPLFGLRQPDARIDFALFMVEALENDELIHEAPAIVGRQTPSALAGATSE